MDFRHAYHEQQQQTREQLLRARVVGGSVRTFHRLIRAGDLTDRQVDDIALRDAEATVNMAIIQHNAELERRR